MLGLQKQGPALTFDSGNALFPFAGVVDDGAKPRAKFVLETMGKLGVKVMAAGAKDLDAGASWLKETAAKAGIKVLSANLKEKGVRVFDGSAVLEAGGVRVGFIGLSPPNEVVAKVPLVAEPLVAAVKAELPKLKDKTDLVVLLAAVKTADAYELAKEFKGQVDFVIISNGEGRGMPTVQKVEGGAAVLTGGQKGQAIGQLTIKADGKGELIDLTEMGREKELLASLELKIKEFEPRLKAATDPQSRALMTQTLTDLKQRRLEQKKKVDAGISPDARTFDLAWVILNNEVVDDPPLKAEVLKFEPTYAGSH